jgi:phospholipid/cholesterol/gamma-HCH transport system substrate-binding protein
VVGLCVLLFLFGYVPAFFKQTYLMTIEMPDALRLNTGSRVKLFGIDIGEVRTIRLKEPAGSGVRVAIELRDEVLIPKGSHAEVDTDLLGGSATLNIIPPILLDPTYPTLATDGSAVIPGELGSLAGAFAQLDRLASSVENLSREWQVVGSNLNILLQQADPAEVDAGKALPTMRTVIQRVDSRLAEFRKVLDGVQRYTGSEDMYSDVTTTAENARKFSEQLDSLQKKADGFLTETQKATTQTAADAQEMLKRYTQLANQLSESTTSLQRAIDQINEGEGTVAKLLTDPTLYDSFEATADRVSRMVDEMTLMLQKWKAEGVPVQF